MKTIIYSFIIMLGLFFCASHAQAQPALALECPVPCVQGPEISAATIDGIHLRSSIIDSDKVEDESLVDTDISASAEIDPSKISGTAWTANNDGDASGLDADLLDGVEGSQFLRNDESGTLSGNLETTGSVTGAEVCISSDCRSAWPADGVWNDNGDGTIAYSSGNVGIGTTSPDYPLDVVGTLRTIEDGASGNVGAVYLKTDGSDNAQVELFDSFGTSKILFTTEADGSGESYIRTGNFGIGTTSPDHPLDVAGTLRVTEDGSSGNVGAVYLRSDGSENARIELFDSFGTSKVLLTTEADGSGESYIRAGNFGIGTTSPDHPLDVAGTLRVTEEGDAGNIGAVYLRSDGSDNARIELFDSFGTSKILLTTEADGSGVSYFRSGSLGIGTTDTGDYELAVEGTIGARELIVTEDSWSDFVFEDDYKLKSLDEVKTYIDQNKHLPDLPSAKEVREQGVNVGKMQKMLLQKIEELTLYVIAQDQKIKQLQTQGGCHE